MYDGLSLWQEHEALYEEIESNVDAYHEVGHQRAAADRRYHELKAAVFEEYKRSTSATAARELVSGDTRVTEAKEELDGLEVDERWILEKIMIEKKKYSHLGEGLAREWGRPSNDG